MIDPDTFQKMSSNVASSTYLKLRNGVDELVALNRLQADVMAAQAAAMMLRRAIQRLPPGMQSTLVPDFKMLIDPATPDTCLPPTTSTR